jgi:hypothetical protein
MTPSLRLAVWLVRAWTDLYTWRMNEDARAVRVGEIESDLWECANERRADRTLPLVILARLVKGMADDVVWRTSHDLIHQPSVRRTAAFGAVATFVTAIAAAGVWIAVVMTPAELPDPPGMMVFSAAPAPPAPPPPPPPPPCKRGARGCGP